VSRRWFHIGEDEVTLAFYGAIVYLAVVSAMGAQEPPPPPVDAVGAVSAAATVLYIAHVFSAVVPDTARAGRLRLKDLGHDLRHDVPLLLFAIVPIVPLLLAMWGVVGDDTGYRLSIRITIALLFVLAVILSRRDGLSWCRAIVAGLAIVAVTIPVIWLESHVH